MANPTRPASRKSTDLQGVRQKAKLGTVDASKLQKRKETARKKLVAAVLEVGVPVGATQKDIEAAQKLVDLKRRTYEAAVLSLDPRTLVAMLASELVQLEAERGYMEAYRYHAARSKYYATLAKAMTLVVVEDAGLPDMVRFFVSKFRDGQTPPASGPVIDKSDSFDD